MPFRAFVFLCLAVLGSVIGPGRGYAQESNADLIPDHRYLFVRGVDFFGADLTNLFNTTQAACERACSAQEACTAFTFNARSNACFPKAGVADQQVYEGATSARKVATDAQVLGQVAARRDELEFLGAQDIQQAGDLVRTNSRLYSFGQEQLADLTAALDRDARVNDTVSALGWAGKAVALSDQARLWARYAELSLAHAAQIKGSDRRGANRRALRAATNVYLRALEPRQQAAAAEVLAQALEANRRGRDMIDALRLANALAPRAELEAALDRAIGKYGFRITDQRVENNAARPRICAVFSEKLVPAGVDYAPFVRSLTPGLVVQADEGELCLDGVEHGARYEVTFRAGLPAASGEVLHKDVRLALYVRDRRPAARFSGRAYLLPRSADAALPVETVNVDTLDLTLHRLSDRNLVRALRDSFVGRPLSKYEADILDRDLAQAVWQGVGEVQNTLNRDMTTRLPLGAALTDQPPGIYVLSAAVPGQDPYEFPAATQWFVLTDLGLSTWSGVDGVQVAVRGLGDTGARPDVTLSLISQANAVLGEAVTDAEGFATFPVGLMRGTGAASPAVLMAEGAGGDITFLPLTGPAFDLSDRGVEGRPPAPPIDTFLTTDRGAYRVGEIIHATVLTRDRQAHALPGLPITAILRRPDGVEYSRQTSQQARAGGHVFTLPLGGDVPRGAWRVDVMADVDAAPLASQTVLVEDFLPERIDFDLSLPETALTPNATPPLQVNVRYLFGAPGAGLRVQGDVRLRPERRLDGWPGYLFGPYDASLRPLIRGLDEVETDAQGRAVLPLRLPQFTENPGMPLRVEAVVEVAEGSGRPVERRLERAVLPGLPLIGIRSLADGVLPEGAEARFDLIALDAQGNPGAMPVRWTVNRVQTQYQWYQLYGNWEWEPVTRRTRIATGEVTLGGTPTPVSTGTDWGTYEMVVEQLNAPFVTTSVRFQSGWYGADDGKDTPDRLPLSLNGETYDVGDTVALRLVPDSDGIAMVTVLSNRVIERRVLPVTAGENTVALQVTEDWGSGAYVTASVLRGMDVAAGQMPARSLGLAHAAVRPGNRALGVSIATPKEVDGQPGVVRAVVSVAGVKAGDTAHLTLAAVDVGVLNLTGFEAPDAKDHYFGQRRLGVELRDVYGRLIDGLNGALGTVRSGGDAAAAARSQAVPPTEKLMAWFSGPVTVGPDGTAVVEIVKPAFNGTIRLMAVAWSETAVGNAVAEVVARDPVVVSAALPRFMAPGDESRLLLELVHAQGPTGEMTLDVTQHGGLALSDVPSSVVLTEKGSAQISVPLRAFETGDHRIEVTVTPPGAAPLRKTLILPVRVNDPETAVTRQFSLAPGKTFAFDAEVLAGLRPGTGSATLTAGPLARFYVPGLLRQLNRYPYGCTEQVTSGAMPLLYLSSVAQQAGIGGPGDIAERVDDAIARVLTRQSSNGAFGLWRASSGEFWLDAYVTDFLARARREGFAVPDQALTLALDNLRNRINYAPDFDRGGEDIAYALLVLAREGAAQMGDLRYYADTKREAFGRPMAAAQLGAALAAYGDPIRADAMFRRAGDLLKRGAVQTGWRSDFGTSLRDTAAVLKLSAEAGSAALEPAGLIAQVRRDGSRLSTQEAAQVVLAAHALSDPRAVPVLAVNGVPAPGPVVRRLTGRSDAAATVENISVLPMDVTLTAYGVPEIAPEAGGYGYAITRRSFSMDGEEISGPYTAGERRVAVIEVTPFEQVGARLIVDDPLPAGLEIDNPSLLRSGDIAGLDWLKTAAPEHAEFRADRFIAAVNHQSAAPFQLAYIVRAITPGTYRHPAATVEDMYRAEYHANTATGQVVVRP
ncbi:alpha-2-macroglobulin family protein [Sulfitobacter sp. JB4-11]|uniref:alpha-2-macroglobulin family protein n=1 Tax=Sulfitobacter rhodophyticola TaxID=3238304 RepID=UPI00351270C0